MKYEINQLNDTDAVVISNEKIKHKDIVLHFTSNSILKADEFHESNGNVTLLFQDTLSKREVLIIECRKVIATISPFKIEGLPMLELSKIGRKVIPNENWGSNTCKIIEGVITKDYGNEFEIKTDTGKTLLVYCDEVNLAELPNQEEDVEKLAEHSSEVQEGTYTTQHKITYKHGFIDGYKAAQKQYSE